VTASAADARARVARERRPCASEDQHNEEATVIKRTNDENAAPKSPKPSHVHGEEAGAIAGEICGGVLGSAAGPPGAIAGMVIGAAAGALVGEMLDREAERAHVRDEELDEEIGVSSGDLGAAKPPAKTEPQPR
jgi:uncharacterized membrane protein